MAPRASRTFWKVGLPFVLFVVIGTTGLAKFVESKYEAVDARVKKRSDRSAQLEMAHKAVVGRLQLDDYELRPVPKPPADEEEELGAGTAQPPSRAGRASRTLA